MRLFSIFLLCMTIIFTSSFSFAKVDSTKQEKITKLETHIIELQKDREKINTQIRLLQDELQKLKGKSERPNFDYMDGYFKK